MDGEKHSFNVWTDRRAPFGSTQRAVSCCLVELSRGMQGLAGQIRFSILCKPRDHVDVWQRVDILAGRTPLLDQGLLATRLESQAELARGRCRRGSSGDDAFYGRPKVCRTSALHQLCTASTCIQLLPPQILPDEMLPKWQRHP